MKKKCGLAHPKILLTITVVLVSLFTSALAVSDWIPINPQPPIEDQIQRIESATNDLTELLEVSHAEAHLLYPNAKYGYSKEYLNGEEPVWVIEFKAHNGSICYKVLMGSQGETMDRVKGDSPFQNTTEKGSLSNGNALSYTEPIPQVSDLYNDEGVYYYYWTLEEKESFSRKWIPVVQTYQAAHPDDEFLQYNRIWQYTRMANGLPDDKALSMRACFRLAMDAIDADYSRIEEAQYLSVYYDVTEPKNPCWRFYFDLRYSIAVDAYTGEILFLKDADPNDYDLSEFLQETVVH